MRWWAHLATAASAIPPRQLARFRHGSWHRLATRPRYDNDYAAADNKLVGTDNDYVNMRATNPLSSQSNEFVVGGYVVVARSYVVIVRSNVIVVSSARPRLTGKRPSA